MFDPALSAAPESSDSDGATRRPFPKLARRFAAAEGASPREDPR